MIAESTSLRFAAGLRTARLRELTGREEYAVAGAATADAIVLLDAMLDGAAAASLAAADRDRLLAAVYERAFGDRIASTLSCVGCGQPFDLDFSLRQLVESIDARAAAAPWRALGDGRYEREGGARVRLPDGNDELAVAALAPAEAEAELLRRCAAEGEERADVEALLEELAPLLDLELTARCPECGHANPAHFNVQSYVLGAIAGERRRLMSEVNRIAAAYGWALGEILALPRSDRRLLVQLIQGDA